MEKEELLQRIGEIQDMVIGFYDCVKSPKHFESILMVLDGLLDIKVEIEAYYGFMPGGAE